MKPASRLQQETRAKMQEISTPALDYISRELSRLEIDPTPQVQLVYPGLLSIMEVAHLVDNGYQVLPVEDHFIIDWSGLEIELLSQLVYTINTFA